MRIETDAFAATSHSPSLSELVDDPDSVLDFCFTANPHYPTDEVLDGLARRLPRLVRQYPAVDRRIAASQIAEVVPVDPATVLVGNGATELIGLLLDEVEGRLAVSVPSFSEYLDRLLPDRVALHRRDAADGYRHDLAGLADVIGEDPAVTAAAVITPDNPSGDLAPLPALEAFLDAHRDLDLVIVDESFLDFAGEFPASLMPGLARFPNLVVLRSMGKHCGVAGLRLGYCAVADPTRHARLAARLPTWNLNTLAEAFLAQLVATDDIYQNARRAVMSDVVELAAGLRSVPGLTVHPTSASFVLVRLDSGPSATEVRDRLLAEHRMYVRDCTNKLGMDRRHLRIATLGRDNDRRLVEALRAVLAG